MASSLTWGRGLKLGVNRKNSNRGVPMAVLTLSRGGQRIDEVRLSMKDARRVWEFLDRTLPKSEWFWDARTDPDEPDDDPYDDLGGEG